MCVVPRESTGISTDRSHRASPTASPTKRKIIETIRSDSTFVSLDTLRLKHTLSGSTTGKISHTSLSLAFGSCSGVPSNEAFLALSIRSPNRFTAAMSQKQHARSGSHGRKVVSASSRPSRPAFLTKRTGSYHQGMATQRSPTQASATLSAGAAKDGMYRHEESDDESMLQYW